MYDIAVRKLALRMVKKNGMVKTSKFTGIGRSTLWRWKKYGFNPKKRIFQSQMFQRVESILKNYLTVTQCTDAPRIVNFLRNHIGNNFKISTKTVCKFIKKLGFTKKRCRTRGVSKGDLVSLKQQFCEKYRMFQSQEKVFVSIDECAFSEKLLPYYGYSLKGTPVILKRKGSCPRLRRVPPAHGRGTHHSLLLAIFSNGPCHRHDRRKASA